MNEEIQKSLERIAGALERIAESMPKKYPFTSTELVAPSRAANPRAGRHPAEKAELANEVQQLIKTYIDAFRARYGEKARPDVGGKVQGQMRTLLKDHPLPRLVALVQAFVQMDDEWFKKKTHDFGSLVANIGKVQTALLNGTARAEDRSYWSRVWGNDGKEDVRGTSREIEGGLRGGAELPRGTSKALMAFPRKDR